MGRIDGLRPHLDHLDTGAPLTVDPVSANAYLGGWGIAAALGAGADVVVCPRVTDAALVVGPAAWWWGWAPTDWDRLAGAVAAGHVIECGPQTAGGNFAFFGELPDLSKPLGFPIAEVDADGSAVITKHPGTGGAITVDTVTAQLLYEIGPPAYANPDVITRFDTVRLDTVGTDRVRISGTRGEPAPPTTKVAINYDGGFRNRMTFVLTGLEQEAKADWVTRALLEGMGGDQHLREAGVTITTRFVPVPADGADQERSSGLLHVSVKAPDERAVGRAFSSSAIELALASIPGFFTTNPPGPAQAYGVYWPALVPAEEIEQVVVLDDGTRIRVDPAPTGPAPADPIEPPRGRGRAGADHAGHGARRALRGPLRRQGRQRQRRGVGPGRRRLRLAGGQPDLDAARANCSPRPATGRSIATSCPTSGRSTSCSSATSARGSPARPRSTRRPRASASTCAHGGRDPAVVSFEIGPIGPISKDGSARSPCRWSSLRSLIQGGGSRDRGR